MFWSGNYIAVRELNSLLKEENVTLSQVLEADDILQECKADNKALMLFLTRPDILNELITLITEEPPKNVELSQQYRHANIACEVLTSHLSMLSDRLSSDTVQMNRLCDFVNRDPPLNPLLASYFSKTVEMLLEKSPKQDCYLYHIVCLRVLDFFKSRRDFLPNLLRHISTSAIADVFKYFIRLDDLFNKIVMEWLEEHQFLESLIQIVTGNYVAEGGERDLPDLNHNQAGDDQRDPLGNKEECEGEGEGEGEGVDGGERVRRVGRERRALVAADNACALLAEVVSTGCAAEGPPAPSRTALALSARLGSAAGVSLLLGGAFTSPGWARAAAAAHAAALLPRLQAVEPALAPHLPLLHRALTHPPRPVRAPAAAAAGVGAARLQIAALIASLVSSPVQEVCTALLALGTPGVLVDLLVEYPENNFLHASVVAMVRNALANAVYRTQYAEHLFGECDLLNRIMDLYEENENKERGPRRGHAGHVVQVALACAGATGAGAACGGLRAPPAAQPRWDHFVARTLTPLHQMLETPLGGTHPAECIYEVDCIMDTLAANFDFSDMAATATMEEMGDDLGTDHDHEVGLGRRHVDSPERVAADLGLGRFAHHDDDDYHKMNTAKSNFLELASQRFDDDMWDEAGAPDAEPEGAGDTALDHFSPWAGVEARSGSSQDEGVGQEQWAQFSTFSAPPVDPFAPTSSTAGAPAPAASVAGVGAATEVAPSGGEDFAAFWPYGESRSEEELEERLRSLQLEEQQSSLASNLLTAMSGMSPAALARLVGVGVDHDHDSEPEPEPHHHTHTPDHTPDQHHDDLPDHTTQTKDYSNSESAERKTDDALTGDSTQNEASVLEGTHVKSALDSGTESKSDNASVGDSTQHESENIPRVPDGTDESKTTVATDDSREGNKASSSGDSTSTQRDKDTDVHSTTRNEAAKIDSTEPKLDSKDACVEDVKSEIETGSSSAIDNEPSVVENEVDNETSAR